MSGAEEEINYSFHEDLEAVRRIAARDAKSSPLPGRANYRFRTLEELMAPLTEGESFRSLVKEEATDPRLRAAWLKE